MKILQIYNQWLLDINELRLMGCSSKSWTDTIGKFWTGLKYAISVLIRENIDFSIYLGNRKVIIQKEDIIIRGKTFEKIIIDYESTSITTNLWIEWSVGQALREFIANAKDEGGDFEIMDKVNTSDNSTVITFDLSQVEEYLKDFVFDWWTEVTKWYYFKKLDEPRRAKVFKEWFLVYEAQDDSSYDYRIDNLTINESRVAEDRHEVKRWIAKIQTLMNKEDVDVIIENEETNLWTFYDYDNLWDWWDNVKKKDVWKNDWYELQKLVKKNIAKQKSDEQVNLLYWNWTYVTHEDEIEEWIFMQEEENDRWWDIDPETLHIYIFKRYPDSYYIDTMSSYEIDYTEVIDDAKNYRKAAQYLKDNNLKTAIEVVQHFMNKAD